MSYYTCIFYRCIALIIIVTYCLVDRIHATVAADCAIHPTIIILPWRHMTNRVRNRRPRFSQTESTGGETYYRRTYTIWVSPPRENRGKSSLRRCENRHEKPAVQDTTTMMIIIIAHLKTRTPSASRLWYTVRFKLGVLQVIFNILFFFFFLILLIFQLNILTRKILIILEIVSYE